MLDAVMPDVLEGADGVVELPRVLTRTEFAVHAIPAGPRGWQLADLSAELDGDQVAEARLTFRAAGNRVAVVAQQSLARRSAAPDELGRKLCTALRFEVWRRRQGAAPGAALAAALDGPPRWGGTTADGWRVGSGSKTGGVDAVRAVASTDAASAVVLASAGLAAEELLTLARNLEIILPGRAADELQRQYRRRLAQRWWDAPRRPYVPGQRR